MNPVPGPYRPVPAPPGSATTGTVPSGPVPAPADGQAGPDDWRTGHPAVDAAVQAIRNASGLPPADQIAQYEAAHTTLQETLATIDQA
ncbi:hypothetical protein O7632_20130 [Solwaraspora sp. WMMD406]|uniref:hypothetical protein n=1 Tax=Solwaraspora sp. WMMD406 TaxID=3016095 RepID=UPI002416089E|nr:hypothetical protein [Solwaraspora sp. WMMD406]MDG4766392.1 hypothetical protein [Solwaraspora sp. WMMD406]